MLTTAELDEIRRQVRQRRHLSWATLDKVIATAIKAATPKPEPTIKIENWFPRRAHDFSRADGSEGELCNYCFSSKEEAAHPGCPCISPFTYRKAGAR